MWSGAPITHRRTRRIIDDTAPDFAMLNIRLSGTSRSSPHDVEGLRQAYASLSLSAARPLRLP